MRTRRVILALAVAAIGVLLFLLLSGGPPPAETERAPSSSGADVAPSENPEREPARPAEQAETRRRWLERAIAEAREQRIRRAEGDQHEATRTERTPESALARTGGPAPPPTDETVGHLEPEYIRERIQELKPLLAECYELALASDPSLEGRLTVEFVIAGEPDVGGIVEESRIDEEASTLAHPIVTECVRETMYTAEFAAPEGGGRVTVRYPFNFAQEEEQR